VRLVLRRERSSHGLKIFMPYDWRPIRKENDQMLAYQTGKGFLADGGQRKRRKPVLDD